MSSETEIYIPDRVSPSGPNTADGGNGQNIWDYLIDSYEALEVVAPAVDGVHTLPDGGYWWKVLVELPEGVTLLSPAGSNQRHAGQFNHVGDGDELTGPVGDVDDDAWTIEGPSGELDAAKIVWDHIAVWNVSEGEDGRAFANLGNLTVQTVEVFSTTARVGYMNGGSMTGTDFRIRSGTAAGILLDEGCTVDVEDGIWVPRLGGEVGDASGGFAFEFVGAGNSVRWIGGQVGDGLEGINNTAAVDQDGHASGLIQLSRVKILSTSFPEVARPVVEIDDDTGVPTAVILDRNVVGNPAFGQQYANLLRWSVGMDPGAMQTIVTGNVVARLADVPVYFQLFENIPEEQWTTDNGTIFARENFAASLKISETPIYPASSEFDFVIRSLSDLPDPVADVITLPGGNYLWAAQVDIGDNRLESVVQQRHTGRISGYGPSNGLNAADFWTIQAGASVNFKTLTVDAVGGDRAIALNDATLECVDCSMSCTTGVVILTNSASSRLALNQSTLLGLAAGLALVDVVAGRVTANGGTFDLGGAATCGLQGAGTASIEADGCLFTNGADGCLNVQDGTSWLLSNLIGTSLTGSLIARAAGASPGVQAANCRSNGLFATWASGNAPTRGLVALACGSTGQANPFSGFNPVTDPGFNAKGCYGSGGLVAETPIL